VARAFLAPGTSAVFSRYAFAIYALAIQAAGAEGIETAAHDFGHDLDAMLDALRADTRVVFIANPNNPTGTWLSNADLLAFLQRVPENVIVVLDEAYGEYLPQDKQSDALVWLQRFPNLVVSRTFSKAYGLAGLRVGYALTSRMVADMMNRVRQPFNVNSLALVAASAALDDNDFIARSYALQSARHASDDPGLIADGAGLYSVVWQFPRHPRRQCHSHVSTFAGERCDCASHRQLRHARIPARQHRTGR